MNDVVVTGRVAIRTGALVWGRIQSIDKATYNSSAQLHIEVHHVDDRQIALNGPKQGTFSGQGFQAKIDTAMMARAMNDTDVKTK